MGRPRALVVVGASLAGLRAVEAVRTDGWDGSIVLVGAEEHLPYDRPPLSKAYLADEESTVPTFRDEETLAGLDVELLLGTPATALDTSARTLEVGDRAIGFDALVVATGARARTLPGTGGVRGVHTVRSLDDAVALRADLRVGARRLVVVGGGFIGSEVASVARGLGLEVTVVEARATPLVHAVGERVGRALARRHERHGTRVRTGVTVTEVLAHAGRLSGVRLSDGTELPADLLVVGVGASPATEWLEGSGLTVDDGVLADRTLAAGPGVWVAGDVARWPNGVFDDVLDTPMRLEHWTSAAEQGARAARNAVDPDAAQSYETVPYFWSDSYGGRIQFVGVVPSHAEVETVAGTEEDGPFTALYRAGDRVVGALAVDMPAEVMKYRRLIGRRASWADALALAEQRRRARDDGRGGG